MLVNYRFSLKTPRSSSPRHHKFVNELLIKRRAHLLDNQIIVIAIRFRINTRTTFAAMCCWVYYNTHFHSIVFIELSRTTLKNSRIIYIACHFLESVAILQDRFKVLDKNNQLTILVDTSTTTAATGRQQKILHWLYVLALLSIRNRHTAALRENLDATQANNLGLCWDRTGVNSMLLLRRFL